MRLRDHVKLSIKIMEKNTVKPLSRKEFRCGARYDFSDADNNSTWCPERATCYRYRTVVNEYDKKAGIENYQNIDFKMAVKNCTNKIEWVEK